MASGNCVERETSQDPSVSHFVYYHGEQDLLGSFGNRPKNVILFGETGAGKSSVINSMANRDVAKTSPDLEGCTLNATPYFFSLASREMPFRIFDTVGLEEPKTGVNTFLGAIEKAHRLIMSLHNAGGIDLLVFCVRAGRLTDAMQRDYRLFFEVLCGEQIPLALIITGLENEQGAMENWWKRNKDTFKKYKISAVAHACITSLPAHVMLYAEQRAQSQDALRDLFEVTLSGPAPNPSFMLDVRNWLATFLQKFRSLLMNGAAVRRGDIARKLRARCGFTSDQASKVAEIITGC